MVNGHTYAAQGTNPISSLAGGAYVCTVHTSGTLFLMWPVRESGLQVPAAAHKLRALYKE